MRTSCRWIVALCALIAVQSGWVRIAAAEDDPFPPVKVVLHPAAEPRPALKYRLLPDVLDRKPGNAAVVYGKVKAEQEGFFVDEELWEKVNDYAMKAPLADLRKEKGAWRGHVTERGGPFYFLDRAARCQFCDWQYPIGEPGQDLYSILLPDAQQMRQFARLLAVRARFQIADGQYDEAIHTLQTGYAVSKHVGDGPFIVMNLMGIANSAIISDQVREFIQQPDAPNLYWALTNLPQPLVDMRPAFDTEMQAIYLSYPELRDLEHKGPPPPYWQYLKDPELRDLDLKEYTPQEWQQLLERMVYRVYRLEFYGSGSHMSKEMFRLAVLGLTLRNYPEAKRFLIARGHAASEVEAMPVPKVVMLYTMGLYDELRDDMFKWYNVPYPEFRAHYKQAEERLKKVSLEKREIIPLAGMLLPAVGAANAARVRHGARLPCCGSWRPCGFTARPTTACRTSWARSPRCRSRWTR